MEVLSDHRSTPRLLFLRPRISLFSSPCWFLYSEKAALMAHAETLPKVLITDIDLNWLQVSYIPPSCRTPGGFRWSFEVFERDCVLKCRHLRLLSG